MRVSRILINPGLKIIVELTGQDELPRWTQQPRVRDQSESLNQFDLERDGLRQIYLPTILYVCMNTYLTHAEEVHQVSSHAATLRVISVVELVLMMMMYAQLSLCVFVMWVWVCARAYVYVCVTEQWNSSDEVEAILMQENLKLRFLTLYTRKRLEREKICLNIRNTKSV